MKSSSFYLATSIICFLYLISQLFCTFYGIIGVDEFWFAHSIYQYHLAIPYRDFSPYKTVLGYYLLLPSMMLTNGFLAPLYTTKIMISIINTFLFFISSVWLKRFFSSTAILVSLVLLLFSGLTFNYSSEIRVDLFSYWFCLFGILLIMENKFFFSGLLIGLAFITSQKALWYIVAINLALGINFICYMRHWKCLLNIGKFNLATLFIISLYIGFWSYLSNVETVSHNIFYDAYIMYKLDSYEVLRKEFWSIILLHNPLVFILPITFLSLFIIPSKDKSQSQRLFLIGLASIITTCLIMYKQIFPYYMLTILPAFLLLFCAFFDWLLQIFIDPEIKFSWLSKINLWGLLFLFFFLTAFLFLFLHLPNWILFLNLVPLCIILFATSSNPSLKQLLQSTLMLTFLFIMLIYPFCIIIFEKIASSGDYQKSMINLAGTLLNDGGDYLAGIEIFYNKNQPIEGMRHLDIPGIKYLYAQDIKLRPAMLTSLYRSPDITQEKIIALLESSKIKLYINNYRILSLPPNIKNYLSNQYEHFWGSIYFYSPKIQTGDVVTNIKFSGNYKIISTAPIFVNHVKLGPHSVITLQEGSCYTQANQAFRLRLLPLVSTTLLDKHFQQDEWRKMLG